MVEDSGANVTPEKQLLKLIEEPDAGNVNKAGTAYKAKRLLAGGFLDGIFAAFKGRAASAGARDGKKPPLSIDIQGVNLILKILILATAAYLVGYVVLAMRNMAATPEIFNVDAAVKDAGAAEMQANLQPNSYYLEKTSVRDIFSPYAEKVKEAPKKQEEKQAVPQAPGLTENLRIVGIAWADEPEVIIEDSRILRTFFLKEGDAIRGGTVKKILQNKIILEYKGQEAELK